MSATNLTSLTAGTPLVFGGDRVTYVSEELAAAFSAGDAIVVLQDSGDVLHVPATDRSAAALAVDAAHDAFASMGSVTDGDLERFFETFARRLEDDGSFAPIAAANAEDVERARARGRSVTRLLLSGRMRADMIAGLRTWAALPSARGQVVHELDHDGWRLQQFRDRLGVVAFVFEGRPNVFADACGVLRGGNTVVFRIGSDALGTARAIVEHALDPALEEAGLPPGAASLVDAPSHAAGWALFADTRLALAVARGSGAAVSQLGAVAQQVGNPVSMHGTGGAWMVAATTADAERFAAAVRHSLDRKVCNTLNTCCIVRDRVDDLVPVFLEAVEAAGAARGTNPKLHVRDSDRAQVPADWFDTVVPIARAEGPVDEPRAEPIATSRLGVEWEWEDSPEVTLVVVDDVDEATELFNRHSPHFVLSLLSEDAAERSRVEGAANAPFVGDGFTRWVDGQYALGTPELGLSNWQLGRLLGRSGILSGDGIHTLRIRAVQQDPDVHR
ncbi:MAG: aldehyde dehydrogenase family protein [Nitriliruptor sp.]|nr:MAG: aldehyde dehydrogenase family protein [Nitriliruptor sp.]